MSQDDVEDSQGSSPATSTQSAAQSPASQQRTSTMATGPARKKVKVSKPRLTATQKSTNHKDAENKRRNAIRERFTDLSRMVPGAEGQERSEQVMLSRTTEFLKEMLVEQRRLEKLAAQKGVVVDKKDRLRDDDYGGPRWRARRLEEYENQKTKKFGKR